MQNLTAEIEIQKKDIERARQELSRMYMELGQVAVSWHSAINYAPSEEAFERLVSVASEKEAVDNRIEALKGAMNEMSASDRQIEQTKLSMKELDKRYDILISSLGAVAIETDSVGKLPQRLEKCLNPMREHEARMEECRRKLEKAGEGPSILRTIHEKKLEKLTMAMDEVFTAVGKRIYESGNFRDVPGQRAKALLDEMERIRFARKNYKNDIVDHRTAINEAQGSLVSMGALGEENRKLRELQNTANLMADRLSDRYAEYGQILGEGIDYWMDDQAPEELQKCCIHIIRQSRKISIMELNMQHTMMERDVDIHNMQMTQLSEQMNHLNSQIQAIENQKRELQARIDVELKAISDLRMKQNEISSQAAQLN